MPDDYGIHNRREATTELNIDEETTKLTATPEIPSSTTGPAPTSSPAPTPSPPSELPDGMIAWAPYSNYSGFGGTFLPNQPKPGRWISSDNGKAFRRRGKSPYSG